MENDEGEIKIYHVQHQGICLFFLLKMKKVVVALCCLKREVEVEVGNHLLHCHFVEVIKDQPFC